MLIDKLKDWIRQAANRVGFYLLVFAIIALGQWLVPLRYLQNYLDTHPALTSLLTGLTIAMALLGTLLFVFTQFVVRVGDEKIALSVGAAAQSRRGVLGWLARRFAGIKITAGFADEASIGEVKRAFQAGLWWKEPRWRRFTLMGLGAFLLLYGLFGLFIVISPPGVKLLIALALAYATVRMVWAFARTEPPETPV